MGEYSTRYAPGAATGLAARFPLSRASSIFALMTCEVASILYTIKIQNLIGGYYERFFNQTINACDCSGPGPGYSYPRAFKVKSACRVPFQCRWVPRPAQCHITDWVAPRKGRRCAQSTG